MGSGGFPIDLILFGMIALFLVLRLRSILGRRTGFERQAEPRIRPVGGLGGRTIDAVAEPAPQEGRALPDPASPPGQALTRMQRVDRNFSAQRFLEGAESAFRIIVGAFAAGDRERLRPLLGDETFRAFDASIAAREQRGETSQTEIRAVAQAAIEQAALAGTMAEITVRFVSDQVSKTVAKDGEILGGSDSVTEITDNWAFQRDLARNDPAWRLVRTA